MRENEFEQVMQWLRDERTYCDNKWDYGNEPPERLYQELHDRSWFWDNGVLNYVGRVRMFSLRIPQGRQALMKLISTLVHLAEWAVEVYGPLPKAGVPSGEIDSGIS